MSLCRRRLEAGHAFSHLDIKTRTISPGPGILKKRFPGEQGILLEAFGLKGKAKIVRRHARCRSTSERLPERLNRFFGTAHLKKQCADMVMRRFHSGIALDRCSVEFNGPLSVAAALPG